MKCIETPPYKHCRLTNDYYTEMQISTPEIIRTESDQETGERHRVPVPDERVF